MRKQNQKPKRSASRDANVEYMSAIAERSYEPVSRASQEPIKAKNANQGRYISSILDAPMTFGIGPAGTGKTWICGALAAEALISREIEKIIITRPAVEAGENLGFLPGDLSEKYMPYLQPFLDVLNERLGKSHVENLIKLGKIEAVPLAFMRGRTFKNAWVILDEGQNTTPTQMKMFLTRLGENCKMIINGDIGQKDIAGMSGLEDAVNRISYIPTVRVVQFVRTDIVRSGLVQEIVQAYESRYPVSLPTLNV